MKGRARQAVPKGSGTSVQGTVPSTGTAEVFTQTWVVNLILDLAGYTPDRDLASMTLVEPSCGTGAFLTAVVDRLVESARQSGTDLTTVGATAVRAYDVAGRNVEDAQKVVVKRLRVAGYSAAAADALARAWVQTGDFLLQDDERGVADFVVGNPPYIRLEAVPRRLMAPYRERYVTMRGRSDIYVGFMERSLQLLRPSGVLGFICPDRWMRNQYGADLRELIAASHAVETVIAMDGANAFDQDVSAYPAIVVVRHAAQGPANIVAANQLFGERDAVQLAEWARSPKSRPLATSAFKASRLDHWFVGRDLWPTGSPAQLSLVAELEARFPPLEDPMTGTTVGVGVATGADEVFIVDDPSVVEADRLLPLVRPDDIKLGSVEWRGHHLVNPWDESGLVDLARYPRLKNYFEEHAEALKARHISRKYPARWYRTIDRVTPSLQQQPKLLLPDIKAKSHPVLDDGDYYPHHNLCFVVSESWDLDVLGGLLLSDVTNLLVGAYCVRMRGGWYRFQPQYLRRIRVPPIEAVKRRHRKALARAFADRDVASATAVALRVYGLKELPAMSDDCPVQYARAWRLARGPGVRSARRAARFLLKRAMG